VAVISSAYDSQYGHPHQQTLDRMAAHNITTYWTATHGSIEFVTDGSEIGVYTQATAPTDPLNLRSAPPVSVGTGEK